MTNSFYIFPTSIRHLLSGVSGAMASEAGISGVRMLSERGEYHRRKPEIISSGLDQKSINYIKGFYEKKSETFSAQYAVIFEDCVLLGQGCVITKNNFLILDSCWEIIQNRIPIPGIEKILDGLFKKNFVETGVADDTCLLLKRPWWRNYGHFLLDSAALFSLYGSLFDVSNLTLVTGKFEDKQVGCVAHQALMAIGEPRRIVEYKDDQIIKFKRLIYPMPVSRPPLFKLPQAIKSIREIFINKKINFVNKRDKIYIKRSNARARRLLNEDLVVDACRSEGFDIVEPENFSLAEQAKIFHNANVIVGIKGAALTNTIFCSPGCAILVISPEHWQDAFFWDIAGQLDLRYYEIFCKTIGNYYENWDVPFEISIDIFLSILKKLL
jgi:hypothetical protein